MTKASWMNSALAAAFALSFPAGGFAATETVNGIKWTYTIDDGRATLGGTDRSPLALARTTAGAVSIPSRLGGRPVTEIGERAFYNCARITAVTIPDTVDEIGEEAFSGCAALASVSLPTSLREIDDRAFALCRSLKGTLEIPEGVRDVGFGAFMGTGLDTLVFPSTLLELGAQQTASGTPLTAVYFKGNAPKLDDEFPPSRADENSPYYGSLASLVTYVKTGTTGWKDRTSALPATWPARVPRKIQNFSGALPAWHIDSSGTLTKVELNGCTEVAIPASVKKIADYAFFGASGLKSVSFPESVSAIGVKAFKGCSALSSVTLPKGLKTLGQAAFQDCTSLKEIEVPAGIDYLWSSTF
ncbi:MAG: leucine-rich repeat domain-containing protein, partial [Kiritimatiellae bacterium]|nr:leucine-rich repeat domain-containing protein [Kiritimatiellia bacterium]